MSRSGPPSAGRHLPLALPWLLLLLLGLGLAGTSGWWGGKIWKSPSNRDDFAIFAVTAFLIFFTLLRLRMAIPSLLLLPATLYIGLTGTGAALAVVWMWVCATLIGAALVVPSGSRPTSIWHMRNAGVGFAVISTLIGVMAYFPINAPLPYFCIFSLGAAVAGRRLSAQGRMSFSFSRLRVGVRGSVPSSLIAATALLGVTFVVFVTRLPELGYDALAFHLNIPARMLELGAWRFDTARYIWSVMPFGADWLYVPPYFLAGEQAARLLNSSFLLATAVIGYKLLAPRAGASLALVFPALLLTWPLSLLETGSAFIESPLAFFFMLGLGELVGEENDRGRWWVLGAIAGFCCAIKLLGVLVLPIFLTGAFFRAKEGRFQRLAVPAFVTAVAACIFLGLSPYAVAFWKTGNPVFPFYNSLFRSVDFVTGSLFGDGSDFNNPFYKQALSFRMFWDMSISSVKFGEFLASGALGIALVVLVPLALLVSLVRAMWWPLAVVAAALAYLLLVFHSQAYLRYAFPVLPWLLLAGVWSLSKVELRPAAIAAVALMLVLVNVLRFPVGFWPLAQFELSQLWSRSGDDIYREQSKPELVAGAILSKMQEYASRRIILLGVDPVYSAFPDGTVSDSWHSWTSYAPALKDQSIRTTIARVGAEIVVHSIGRGNAREAELMSITDELFRVGDVRVALVKQEKLYPREHIASPDLSRLSSSRDDNGPVAGADGVKSTVNTPLSQVIRFAPLDLSGLAPNLVRLLKLILVTKVNVDPVMLEIGAHCAPDRSFESVTRWFDGAGHFISEDKATYACPPDNILVRRRLLRPGAALRASLSIGSVDSRDVTLTRISMRTTE